MKGVGGGLGGGWCSTGRLGLITTFLPLLSILRCCPPQASVERLSRQFAEGAAAMIEEQRRATGEATAAQREESRRQQAAYMNDLAALNREVDAYRNEAQAAGGTLHSAIERVNARWGEGGQGRVGHNALWGMISARVLQ